MWPYVSFNRPLVGAALAALPACIWVPDAALRMVAASVVAEGVKFRAQRQFLIDAGCESVQGFYFSRPLPVSELEARWLPGPKPEDDAALIQQMV